ncbi:TWiK family of potassium channels protein 18 [Stomoxys calcitrans]|uniref:Potassium channel domain-containing protein n=1 Tax=Stomoxys calcitrans TaxID=35570 RepID=A0A1I8P845_STOCA|nr:TWiK family of potassium channels protein 18 [Stomoxys calcitrans]
MTKNVRNTRAGSFNASSTPSNRPRKRFKRCCRNFVTFMCTQVGVGALIVIYAICGAFSFRKIEGESETHKEAEVTGLRTKCAEELWNVTELYNTLDKPTWQNSTDHILQKYQKEIAAIIKQGYDYRKPADIWSFPAALMFCLSVITMIGYGNMVPRTPWGKGFTVIYATFGIPLYILYFLNMGKVLARSFQFLYRSLHECTHERSSVEHRLDALENGSLRSLHRKKIIVPSTACLWVIIFYIFTGTIMFANWEKWSFLNSFYFCMTSLCKIGFGDFVPGASLVTGSLIAETSKKVQDDPTVDPNAVTKLQRSIAEQHSKLAINFIYMLIGMGLVAMCYNLMREEVRVKLKELKEDTKLCLDDTRTRFVGCCGGHQRRPYDNEDGDDYY